LEYNRLPPGAVNYPFHFHSAQWELYVVVSGKGLVRDEKGRTEVVAGDTFVFPPGQAHQISNSGTEDLVYYVIADNPIGECCYYPDSKSGSRHLPRSARWDLPRNISESAPASRLADIILPTCWARKFSALCPGSCRWLGSTSRSQLTPSPQLLFQRELSFGTFWAPG